MTTKRKPDESKPTKISDWLSVNLNMTVSVSVTWFMAISSAAVLLTAREPDLLDAIIGAVQALAR